MLGILQLLRVGEIFLCAVMFFSRLVEDANKKKYEIDFWNLA